MLDMSCFELLETAVESDVDAGENEAHQHHWQRYRKEDWLSHTRDYNRNQRLQGTTQPHLEIHQKMVVYVAEVSLNRAVLVFVRR